MRLQVIVAALIGLAGMSALNSPAGAASRGSSQCDIKGNVNTRGERIYHMPGDEYYDKTRISASHGERWFCSEEEARAAGWRRSKV